MRWTPREKEIVRELWPTAAREEILKALRSRTWRAVKCKAQKLGVRRNLSGCVEGPLTEREEQVLIGGLLGDGCLRMRYANASYEERKRSPDIEYLRWKAGEIARFRPRIKEGETEGVLWTRVHPELNPLRHRWYSNGHGGKQVALEDAKKLGPLGLAVWAQDDGCLKASLHFEFETHRFGWEGNKVLQRVLEENFGLHARLKRDRSIWILCFYKRAEVRKLSEIIEPHVHPCMQRKIICAETLERHRKWRQRENQRQNEKYALKHHVWGR